MLRSPARTARVVRLAMSAVPISAFADQFLDAALQLALFLFAPAQAPGEVGAGQLVGRFRTERDANEVVAKPDDPGEEGAALSRDRQAQRLLGKPHAFIEFQTGAVFGDVANHAIPGSAVSAHLGDAAIDHLVARALASFQHAKLPTKREHFYAPLPGAKARHR